MPKFTRSFVAGRMNKVTDERLLPDGEYIDAMNVRMGSTELSEIGVIENTKGNEQITTLRYTDGTPLSNQAKCIGAYEDGEANTLYWFVHDPNFPVGATGKLDLIVSFNVVTGILTYHVISIDDGNGVNTTLNFNESYLITGISLIKTGTISENLLFFTDDLNPPRFINPTRLYSIPTLDIDSPILAEQLLVIKRPPIESPSITTLKLNGQENFMETRFLCFAYRYRYADNEYSAISQFSAPAFIPNPFEFSINSFLNEGMVNEANGVNITFNTGGPLVKGIDLLFKEADSNIIKVIEKLDKQKQGYVDNANYTFLFSNSKIFTILPESEVLRLYDNVPLQAKAQTIMGNRLMYANYIEGYDLVDSDGSDVQFIYEASLTSESVGDETIPDATTSSTYTIDGSQTISDSAFEIDLTGLNLVSGAAISIDITYTHSTFTSSTPAQETANTSISFTFFLPRDYTSVYDLATSTEFEEAIGTITNIQPMATACDGITFTDTFNCSVPSSLDAFLKYGSGISAVGQPITILTSTSSSIIGFQLPAVEFVDNLTTPTVFSYEYYEVTFVEATYQEIANPTSLHSNRGYEIGIVYMDEFNRSSTALVSKFNTVFVPCGNAQDRNTIQVTIPPQQKPPYWATRYKFVIKPDASSYETIYSSIYFQDPNTNNAYFLLEGENARKVDAGTRLIVKRDSDGATENCVYATVLEKEAKQENFITVPSEKYPGVDLPIPGGVYMKMNPTTFSAITDEDAIVSAGTFTVNEDDSGEYPLLRYPMNIKNPNTGNWEDYTVPAGSRIKIKFEFRRIGKGDGNGACEKRDYTVDTTLIASANYDNMMDWWNGDNVGLVVENGAGFAGGGQCTPTGQYVSTMASNSSDIPTALCINYFRWYRNPSTQELVLLMTGTESCSWIGKKERKRSSITATVDVFRAETLMVFETEPLDANPDIFYENNLSLPITNGFHEGNIQDQTTTVPAIIDTQFFNCYSFGNGVESYKIRDSIVTKTFNFGNRVTAVSNTAYKRVDRFADITYSGVYFDESNVNRLNEFNLGALNFKQCEDSFGPIQLLDGRETDVLVLQEDKISYVLAGKNLLSDAGVGSSLTSVPEVLGTQIARTEKYGISNNPESYVNWGYDRYFTDVKRGAVIQLKGGAAASDQLRVISEQGMRTWFRDTFITTTDTQKLGAYDPYMNEYVLSTNEEAIPQPVQCLSCGISQTFNLNASSTSFCVNLGVFVGDVDITFDVIDIDITATFTINATYNSVLYTTGPATGSGTLTFNKSLNNVNQTGIGITSTGNVVLSVNVGCPNQIMLGLIEIVLTNNADAGKTIHTQYNYINGSYTSPIQTNFVTFISGSTNPLASFYNITNGAQGFGSIPLSGSDVYMYTNKISPDSFDFDISNSEFRYLTSNTLYDNTPGDLATLLSLSTAATPITQSGNVFQSSFIAPTLQDYLYLIWDLTASQSIDLCYSNVSASAACCACVSTNTYYINASSLASANAIFTDSAMTICASDGFYSDGIIVREQSICTLLPQQPCPSCAQPCPVPTVSGSGQDYYILDVDLGSATGAVIVHFNPNNGPCGLMATYNGINYTSVSSSVYGYLASGATNQPVYLGQSSFDCGILIQSPYSNVPIFYWDGATGWTPSAAVASFSIVAAQKQLTTASPSDCYMVIPKTSATPTQLRVIVPLPCPLVGTFDIDVLCPAPLTSFGSSTVRSNSNLACAATVTQTYYVHHVNGSAGVIDLYDMVFSDINGQFPLTDGYYQAPTSLPGLNQWFKVENGVVTLYGPCTYGTNYLLEYCHDGTQIVADYPALPAPGLALGTFVTIAALSPCAFTVVAYSSATPTQTIDNAPPGLTCGDVCAEYDGTNNTGGIVTVNYTDCPGVIQSVSLNPGDTFQQCCRVGSISTVPPNVITFSALACCP